jgi:hypothetical protein
MKETCSADDGKQAAQLEMALLTKFFDSLFEALEMLMPKLSFPDNCLNSQELPMPSPN